MDITTYPITVSPFFEDIYRRGCFCDFTQDDWDAVKQDVWDGKRITVTLTERDLHELQSQRMKAIANQHPR